MRQKKMYINYRLMLSLFIVFVLISCNKSPQKPDTVKKNDLPKLPKILTELEDEVLKIMYDLDSVSGINKAIEKQKINETEGEGSMETAAKQEDEKGKEEGNKKEEKGSDGSKDKKSEKAGKEEKVDMNELIVENEIIIPLLKAGDIEGSFEKNPTIPSNIDKVWSKINDNVTDVHKKWNVLEAQVQSGKVPKSKTEDFEKILNDLTLSVADKEVFTSLVLANELTKITTNFRSYFDGIGNHGVYGMYYHIRATILFAASDNYTKAMKDLDEASKISDSIRQDLIQKDSENLVQKLEFSIEDFKKQLTDKNFYLSQIKAPIVIKNIKLVQDVFETQK